MRIPRFPVSPVSSPGAKSSPRQVIEMLGWGSRLMVSPTDYKTHRLYLRGKSIKDAEQYLSGSRSPEILAALNNESDLLVDKLHYERHFRSHGLPVPGTLAVIAPTESGDELPLTSEQELLAYILEQLGGGTQIVIKPRFGIRGLDVHVITALDGSDETATVHFSNGTSKAVGAFVREIIASGTEWLVQERVKQHALLDSLNSTSLNTCRVATFRRQNGDVDIDYAVLRIGRPKASVDGFSAGGLVVKIDPKTGAFAPSGQQKAKHSLADFPRHPDSDVAFAGLVMPHWDLLLDLARSFAAAAGDNRYIGWDIGMTESGPVFVEGNHNWDVQLAQVGSTGLLTDEWLRRLSDETDMQLKRRPAPQPLTAYRYLSN